MQVVLLHARKEFRTFKTRSSRPIVAGTLERVHTATPGERDREQDMGFPIASAMLQSMEALHWLEGCPCYVASTCSMPSSG
jgi:hypothetical protein